MFIKIFDIIKQYVTYIQLLSFDRNVYGANRRMIICKIEFG